MIGLAKAQGALALHELDAVEHAGTQVVGAPERVQTTPADEEKLAAHAEIGNELAVAPLAQEVAAHGRRRGEPGVELDECRRRVLRAGTLRIEPGVAAGECLGDRAHAQLELGQRALLEQVVPACRPVSVDGETPPRLAEDAPRARHGACRLHDRVADHRRRDRGPGQGVDGAGLAAVAPRHPYGLTHVEADVTVDEGPQVLIGNADLKDGLVVLEQVCTAQPPLEAEADEDVERLAREPLGGDHLSRAEDVTDELALAVGGGRRRIAGKGTEALGFGQDHAHRFVRWPRLTKGGAGR